MAEINNDAVGAMHCIYKNDCTDKGEKCKTCKKNPERSYYEPVETPVIYPYVVPWYPYYPYYPIATPYYPYYPVTVTY